MKKTLFLGAGGKTDKLIQFPFIPEDPEGEEIITLDIQGTPDVLFDLWDLHLGRKLPFEDESITEIHAYEVLEHFGTQGDFKGFFQEWTEYHRILRMGGCFALSVPVATSEQQWGDPGHVRGLNGITFGYLGQHVYKELDENPKDPRTDYRQWWQGNFVKLQETLNKDANRLGIALQKQPVIDYNKAVKAL